MATYQPPTESDALFNTLNFKSNNESLTFEEANKKFLRYPIAQGNNSLLTTNANIFRVSNGTQANPSYSFSDQNNMGMFRSSPNNISFSTSNNNVFTIGATAAVSVNPFRIPNGSSASPALQFSNNNSMGLWRVGNNIMGFAVSGNNIYSATGTGISLSIDGTNVDPVIYWGSNSSLGLYRKSVNNLCLSSASSDTCSFSNTSITTFRDVLPSTHNSLNIGQSTSLSYKDAFIFNGVTTGSDRRLKENIINISHGLETVKLLNPIEYTIKEEISPTEFNKINLGLLADEVDILFNKDGKEYKFINKDGEYLGLNYVQLIPVLIKAIQQLSQEIDILKKNII